MPPVVLVAEDAETTLEPVTSRDGTRYKQRMIIATTAPANGVVHLAKLRRKLVASLQDFKGSYIINEYTVH